MEKQISFREDGVQVNGTFIKYDSKVMNIQREYIDHLSNTPFDCWNAFLLFQLLTQIKEEVNVHLVCPVNVKAIEILIDRKIKEQPKIVWTNFKKFLAAIAVICGAIIGVLNIILLIKQMGA